MAAKSRSSAWRLHQARGVCSGSPKDRWVRRLLQKADPRFRCGQGTRTGLTGLVVVRLEVVEAEDTCRDRMLGVEATRGVIAGRPSDGKAIKFPNMPFEGLYHLEGILVTYPHRRTSYINRVEGLWQLSLGL